MADEETNKLVDEVEAEEVKKPKDTTAGEETSEQQEEVTEPVSAETVGDEVANPPVEEAQEAGSIEELFSLVKQLQAQVDALSSIDTQQEEPQAPQQEQQPEQPQETPVESPDEIEELLDL